MKKIILTLAAISMAFPSFALSDFNIDKKLKEDITSKVKTSADEQVQQRTQVRQEKGIHPLLKLITDKMDMAEKVIAKNIEHPFPRWAAPNYLEGQIRQQKAYQQMREWGVAQQIFDYIKYNFSLNKVTKTEVNCNFNGETKIEVRFTHYDTVVAVTYKYDPKYKVGAPAPIRHITINK